MMKPIFSIRDLQHRMNDQTVLAVPELDIIDGRHLLLLGASGTGKSSLMHLLAGLNRATQGEISYRNQNYQNLTTAQLDRLRGNDFGFVFQKLHLIGHLNIRQNIALAQKDKDPAYITQLMAGLGLLDLEKRSVHSLSLGEAQRVAIARAVANKPRVIFADEPSSALDDTNTKKVIELLLAQAQENKATLIVATHDIRLKSYFSDIYDFDNARRQA